jgi:hypothetical protein
MINLFIIGTMLVSSLCLYFSLQSVSNKCEYYKGRANFFEKENDTLNTEKELLIAANTELRNIILDFDAHFEF